MKSHNTKVNRLLSALAVELKDLPDEKIELINDERDGYDFDFVSEVRSFRRLLAWTASK